MSLTSTFVQAEDGFYYKNPVLFGEHWYVCFDDNDPPEIVVRKIATTTPASATERAKEFLKKAGVKATSLELNVAKANRLFPPKWEKFSPAISFFFRLEAPIPIPQQFDAKVEDADFGCVYDWCRSFPTEVVLGPFRKPKYNSDFATWFLHKTVWTPADMKEHRLELQKKILERIPQLSSLIHKTDEEIIESLGTRVKLWK